MSGRGATHNGTLVGRQKAAALLVSLGPERAAGVLGLLPDHEIETLSLEMAKMRDLTPEASEAVMRETLESAAADGYLGKGGFEYVREVLERSLGGERSSDILKRLAAVIEKRPFEFLRRSPPEQIVAFLRSEAPQTQALVIANLDSRLAGEVLAELTIEQQADVAIRIAVMNETSPEVIKQIESVMRQKLASVISQEYASAGGVESLADILSATDRGTERNVIDKLAEFDAELAEQTRMLLFVFEDIVKLDDRSIQALLKEVDQRDVALALRGVPDEVRERVLSNMSGRAAEMLAEEIDFSPPQRRSVVEDAQGRIVARLRALEEAEVIMIGRGPDGDDEVV